jgi:hypothetical protein
MSTVADVIAEREITEVLHFTTNHGVLGMFAKRAILPRRTLPEEKYLEHVYKPNAEVRKDPAWTGYVSLSISRVNTEFFGVSRYWHRNTDTWWAIVSLDPEILCHDDVVFVTTNNIYPARRRGKGPEALRALFADPVLGYYSHPTSRPHDMPKSWTTDVQAEALYPGEISTDYVRRVYVLTHEHADLVASQYDILRSRGNASDPRSELPIDVRPDLFA